MKKFSLVLVAILALLTLVFLGGAVWLLGTTDGARYLLAKTAESAGAHLEIGRLEGRLLDELSIERVSFAMPSISVQARSLKLHWSPAMLLAGNIAVKSFDLQEVTIVDSRPQTEQPFDLSWPILSGPATRLNGWIETLTLNSLSYRRNKATPLEISKISARVDLHRGQAAITGLTLQTPAATATGDVGISFRIPLLNLFTTIQPTKPAAGFSRFLVHASLSPARKPEQASGVIHAVAVATETRSLQLTANVGIARTFLRMHALSLTEAGRTGRLTGKAEVSFAESVPAFSLHLQAEKLDLSRSVSALPSLDGAIDLAGTVKKYRGTLSLAIGGSGMRSAALAGAISGTDESLSLVLDRGSWLGGKLLGTIAARWHDGLFLAASLSGRNLNPAAISPDWTGVINLDLNGEVRKNGEAEPLRGKIEGTLLASTLRGRQLNGELSCRFADQHLLLDRLQLKGKGFDLNAAGDSSRKIDFALLADDLGGLVPGTSGSLRLKGAAGRKDGQVGGTLTGTARRIQSGKVRIGDASLDAALSFDREQALELELSAHKAGYGRFMADTGQLHISGTQKRHHIDLELASPSASFKTALQGSYRESSWKGTIMTLAGRDTVGPWRMERTTALTISSMGISMSRLSLSGNPGEMLELDGTWFRSPGGIVLASSWQKLNLARIGAWFATLRISGASSGTLALKAPPGNTLRLSGAIRASGIIESKGFQARVQSGIVRLDTAGRTIQAETSLDLADKGKLSARMTCDTPTWPLLPDHGDFDARLDDVDLAGLKAWLPEGLSLSGRLSARSAGKLLSGGRLQLTAQTNISRGQLISHQKGGEIRAELNTAELSVTWRDQAIDGSLAVELAETGHLAGTFRLPLPARLPTAMIPGGALSATLEGTVHENGIIAALLPGLIQESRGELAMQAHAGGTWSNPNLTGSILLSKAGCYLPRAGIRITDIKAAARLEQDRVVVDSFSARSGPGSINGTGVVELSNWKMTDYRATIRGDRFQFVYLPELQVIGTPRLDISGTTSRLTARGDLFIPELLVAGSQSPSPVRPSDDVVVVDAPLKKAPASSLALDMQVRVAFGDKVFIKAEGIDARLDGVVDLTMRSLDDIAGKGEIRVVKGSYKAYGVNLDITKGRLTFTGGPVNRPNLDILATRTVGDVVAGVIIVGKLNKPVVRLYSEPAMPDSDIMGYIVLGQPLSGDQAKVNAVMKAAGLLLSAGQSAVLGDQITNRFGIDTLGVEQDKSDATTSIVTVGKYLTPKLFISYGRALFSPTSYLKARYTFSERWEVETWTGTESGVDVYYKINFD